MTRLLGLGSRGSSGSTGLVGCLPITLSSPLLFVLVLAAITRAHRFVLSDRELHDPVSQVSTSLSTVSALPPT